MNRSKGLVARINDAALARSTLANVARSDTRPQVQVEKSPCPAPPTLVTLILQLGIGTAHEAADAVRLMLGARPDPQYRAGLGVGSRGARMPLTRTCWLPRMGARGERRG